MLTRTPEDAKQTKGFLSNEADDDGLKRRRTLHLQS